MGIPAAGEMGNNMFSFISFFLPEEIIARERKLLRAIISSSAYSTGHIPHFPSGRETGLICLFFPLFEKRSGYWNERVVQSQFSIKET